MENTELSEVANPDTDINALLAKHGQHPLASSTGTSEEHPDTDINALLEKHGLGQLEGTEAKPTTLGEYGRTLKQAVKQVPGYVAQAIEGAEPYTEEPGKLNQTVEEAQAAQKQYANRPGKKTPLLGGLATAEEIRQSAPSMASSVAGMAPTLAGAGAGALAGSALGPIGTAIGGGIGAIGGYMGMKRAAENQTIRSMIDQKNAERKAAGQPPLTLPEKKAIQDQANATGEVSKIGHGEALGESAGTLAELALMRSPVGGVVGALLPTHALGRMAAVGAGKALGILGTEVGTETLTQQMQQPPQVRLGLEQGPERSMVSPEDWAKSFGEVAKPTVLATLPMAGLAGVGGMRQGYVAAKKENQQPEVAPSIDPVEAAKQAERDALGTSTGTVSRAAHIAINNDQTPAANAGNPEVTGEAAAPEVANENALVTEQPTQENAAKPIPDLDQFITNWTDRYAKAKGTAKQPERDALKAELGQQATDAGIDIKGKVISQILDELNKKAQEVPATEETKKSIKEENLPPAGVNPETGEIFASPIHEFTAHVEALDDAGLQNLALSPMKNQQSQIVNNEIAKRNIENAESYLRNHGWSELEIKHYHDILNENTGENHAEPEFKRTQPNGNGSPRSEGGETGGNPSISREGLREGGPESRNIQAPEQTVNTPTFAGKPATELKSPTGGTAIYHFTTAQGSEYVKTDDGQAIRNKSFHANTGGSDTGVHNWYTNSVFIAPNDSPVPGTSFGLAVAKLKEKGATIAVQKRSDSTLRVLIKDGNIWRNATSNDAFPAAVKIGSISGKEIISAPFTETPTIGHDVFEYNQHPDGRTADVHPGSPVDSVTPLNTPTTETVENGKSENKTPQERSLTEGQTEQLAANATDKNANQNPAEQESPSSNQAVPEEIPQSEKRVTPFENQKSPDNWAHDIHGEENLPTKAIPLTPELKEKADTLANSAAQKAQSPDFYNSIVAEGNVPWIAAAKEDGSGVNIDPRVNQKLQTTYSPERYAQAKTALATHELSEQALMRDMGEHYEQAHNHATHMEESYLRDQGWSEPDIKHYNDILKDTYQHIKDDTTNIAQGIENRTYEEGNAPTKVTEAVNATENKAGPTAEQEHAANPLFSRPVEEIGDRRQNPELRNAYEVYKNSPSLKRTIAENKALRERLYTNPLSKVPNKIAFAEGKVSPFVASIDLDALKFINDNVGHAAGDELLKLAANVLKKHVEIYHVSGDEYWAKGDSAEQLDAGLKAALAELESGVHVLESEKARFNKPSFSYGIASTEGLKGNNEEVLKQAIANADEKLLKQKTEREETGQRAGRGEKPQGYERKLQNINAQNPFPSEQAAIDHLVQNFGEGINRLIKAGILTFTETKDSWPTEIQNALRGNEEAAYVPLTRKIYIDLNAIEQGRLNPVMLHELGEHFGLKAMLGVQGYEALQQQIKHRAQIEGSQTQKVWKQVAKLYPELKVGSEEFVAEVIAKLGETGPMQPWYRRLLIQVKAFLMRHGLARGIVAGTISDADLHGLLVASLHSAARGLNREGVYLFPSEYNAGIMASRPVAEEAGETAEEQTPKYQEWKEGLQRSLRKMTDKVASQKYAVLSVGNLIEIGSDVVKNLPEYKVAARARSADIAQLDRRASRIVNGMRYLPKIMQRKLYSLQQNSTLDDIDASKAWRGVETSSKENPFPIPGKIGSRAIYRAYTQANLAESFTQKIKDAAIGAETTTGNAAYFENRQDAENFVAKLEEFENQQNNAKQSENNSRKERLKDLSKIYESMPDKVKVLYTQPHNHLQEIFFRRLEALYTEIDNSIIDKTKATELKTALRIKFESNSVNNYYAPLERFGQYWFYGVDKNNIPTYRMLESAKDRDLAMGQYRKENPGYKTLDGGKSISALAQQHVGGADPGFVLKVQEMLKDSKMDKEESDRIQDEIYQMYLAHMPDVSMRHHAQNRKGTAGFEKDQARSYAHVAHHSASQLANMLHGKAMGDVINTAMEVTKIVEMSNNRRKAETAVAAAEGLGRITPTTETELERKLLDAGENERPILEKQLELLRRYASSDLHDTQESIDAFRQKQAHLLDLAKGLDFNSTTKAKDILLELQKAYNATMNPGGSDMDQVAGIVRALGFIFNLGFSLSAGVLNGLQTPGVAMPVVAGQFGYAKTIKAFQTAMNEFSRSALNIFHKDENGNYDNRDEDGNSSISVELNKRLKTPGISQAEKEKLQNELQFLQDRKDDDTISKTQTMDVIGIGKEGSNYGGWMHDLASKMGWTVHHGERLNREVTLMAAFRLAMEKYEGQEGAFEKASQYALWANERAHFNYEPSDAARIFRGWPAQLALQFKKYPRAMLFLWAKTASDLIKSKRATATAEEKALGEEAGRTLGALALMQVAFAGVFGLPMMGMAASLLNIIGGAFDDDDEPFDIEKEARLKLTEIGGEEFATAVVKGAFNVVTPLNISSRMDMSDPFIRPPENDLEGKDLALHYIGDMAGPSGGILVRLLTAQQRWHDGELFRAAEQALPKAVGDVIKAIRFATQDAQTLHHEMIKEMTPAEVFAQALGFSSSDLEVKQTFKGYAKGTEKFIQTHRQDLINKYVLAQERGDELPSEEIDAWKDMHPTWEILPINLRKSEERRTKNQKEIEEFGYTLNPKLAYLHERYDIGDED